MKKNLHHIKKLQNPFIVFVLFAFINQSKAQTLQRQSIGSCGTYMLAEGTLIQQTVGQPYATTTNYNNGITFRPGFQQPVFSVSLIISSINLTVFPNPATELVTIRSEDILEDANILVMDISGKLLINQQINEFRTFSFNCENWANGVYMISVSDAKLHKYSGKLVISK